MTVAAPKPYTAEEYLALEVESELRHEYRAGEIAAFTGGTPAHNRLSSALNALLWFGLRKQPYAVYVTDQRLWIPAADLYTYPDIMVLPEPSELKPGRKDTVTNPVFIAEVLSRSTQSYDRGDKFFYYRTLETFQEYVLIDQYRPFVEHHVRQSEHRWLLTEYRGLETSFSLVSLPIELSLGDLYEGVDFEAAEDA